MAKIAELNGFMLVGFAGWLAYLGSLLVIYSFGYLMFDFADMVACLFGLAYLARLAGWCG